MSKNVFANGNEISAKKDGNKTIAALPDVCLSPPSPPAGPIPIPYPNTSDASKTSGGSKSVKIGGKEIGLKNKSKYKDSSGDEAATKSLGMGVVSHNIQGPMKHVAWSMDVKIEGYNAIRHMDMTTHNHTNMAQPDINIDQGNETSPPEDEDCAELENDAEKAVNEDLTESGGPPGTALVTAKHSSGAKFKACRPSDAIKSGKSKGYSPKQSKPKKKGDTMACGGGKHMKYKNNVQGGHNHAEATIIEDVVAKQPRGGSITMRTNWNVGHSMSSHSPCNHCKSTICKTALECGITIYICAGDDPMKKKKAPCKTVRHGPRVAKRKGRSRSHGWSAGRRW